MLVRVIVRLKDCALVKRLFISTRYEAVAIDGKQGMVTFGSVEWRRF